jgi:lipopolysaccharide heptosyltransferase II
MSVPASFSTDAWQQARNLLCVRLDCLGDVLMTTPAIRALKESAPGRRITLLTSPGGAAAARCIREIDEVLVYDAPWMKAAAVADDTAADFALLESLRQRQFEAAVIFTVFSQNPLPAATFCYLSQIPLRLAHCRENPYQLLTHWVRECEPEAGIRHEVRRQLDLVAAVGATTNNERLSFSPTNAEREDVRRLLAQLRMDSRAPWLVAHVGSSAPSRRYPAALFAEVIHQLEKRHGLTILLTGQREEIPLVEEVRCRSRTAAISLAGQLPLGQFAALLEAAPLLLSNNTGPVHLAAAVGTPVVDLYALTNPQHTPWQVPHRVLSHDVACRNCFRSVCPEGHQDCLAKIPPATVIDAVLELLQETHPSLSPVAHLPASARRIRSLPLCTP